MPDKEKHVLLVDSHPIFRAGLESVLLRNFPGILIRHAQTLADAIDSLHTGHFDLLITDIHLDGKSGLEILEHTRQIHPPVPVLVISSYPVQPFGCRVIRQGAAGYLGKHLRESDLVEAVRQIADAGRYISTELALALADAMHHQSDQPRHEKLSNRELHVLIELANGKCIKEIAAALSLSPKTVSTYRSRVAEKLGIRSDTELVKYSVKHHLIPPIF